MEYKVGTISKIPCPKCGSGVSIDAQGRALCYSCGKIVGKVTK